MLADWIGSDERGFPFREPDDPPREACARAWAADALARIGLAVEPGRVAVQDAAVGDAAANGFPLNTVQRAVADLPLDPPPQLVVLEAETGSGKTEAALLHFKRLFEAGLVDGLYFALPTRSSASQIQNRVVAWTKRLFPTADRPRAVLALPGYVQADDRRGNVLPRFEVLWEDDPDEVERQRRWAAEHPKRYMAGQIVVGTIDQALLGGLQVPYAHLRSSALLRHLLVVDEVHASDAYMTAVLRALLDAHLSAGGFVLLMSATLGTVARETLQGLASDRRTALADALPLPYPALTCTRDVPVAIAAAGSVKRVTIECRPHLDQPQEVVSEAVRAADAGAKVLVVRNTVADAVALFEALRDRFARAGRLDLLLTVEGVPTLHHGRFALEDRLLLDQAVEVGLGRGAARPRGLVVVGTQTLEQSLDIDADLLVTDLCPMDVLLQRIGRLHRHPGSRRPNGFVDPRCIVLVPAERDLTPFIDGKAHGLGSVYADLRIVQATRDLLEDHATIEIPTMSRALVEQATHPEALERIVRDGGSAWQRHAATVLGEDYSSRGIAALHVIDRSRPFGSFTFASIDQRVTTRLGADDRLLTLAAPGETPPGGAFGQPVTTLKMPGHLVKGVPGDAAVRNLTASPAGFVFALGDRSFLYDAMGLRRGSD